MRAALIQLTSTDDPETNLASTLAMIDRAQGTDLIVTPEVTNCVSASRTRQQEVLQHESDDITLAELRNAARTQGKWLLIGSLALKTDDADGRFANRSFLIAPDGAIAARYDKIHMFDVDLGGDEIYRESAGYRPGQRAVIAQTDHCLLGMTICYDLRFPHLFRALGQAGAQVICVPSAFAPATGLAHWEVLLRARAIETGAFILAPAQTGVHPAVRGKERRTYGHSLAVAPWGQVLADAGTEPGVTLVDLSLELVAEARQRVPALNHDRAFTKPKA